MRLNLPILDDLSGCRSILVSGMGGGFDVFCGLPAYLELRARGLNVHLSSFSFTAVERVKGGTRLSPTLVGVDADPVGIDAHLPYYPELHLARWFREARGEEVTVWAFAKGGAEPLTHDYRTLAEHLALDAIVLIDGRIDSLSIGDEERPGTVVEDALSLQAVSRLPEIPVRLIGCVGFGAEREVTHAHALENVAALTAAGAFRGACALAPGMEAARLYEEAVTYAHAQRGQDASVINASIVSALQGRFGDYHLTEKTRGSRLWISPLMLLYWFFDLEAVAARNRFLSALEGTMTFQEAVRALSFWRQSARRRAPARIPLD